MKLDDLGVTLITEFEGAVHPEAGVTDIVITGHIPGSDEWDRIAQKLHPQPKSTPVYYGKKGEARSEIPRDPRAKEKRIKLLAMVVTDLTGIEGWEFSDEAVLELFLHPDLYWLVNAWEDHLEDEKKAQSAIREECENWAQVHGWLNAREDREGAYYPPTGEYTAWLIGIAQRIGLSYGDGPMTYSEVVAWLSMSAVTLSIWEIETIVKNISTVFVNARGTLTDEDTLPPWMPPGQRELLEQQLADFESDFGKIYKKAM